MLLLLDDEVEMVVNLDLGLWLLTILNQEVLLTLNVYMLLTFFPFL